MLFLVAHPDDESMFFLPTIYELLNLGYRIRVVCFSNGNSTIREKEMVSSCNELGVECVIKSIEGIVDGMENEWNIK